MAAAKAAHAPLAAQEGNAGTTSQSAQSTRKTHLDTVCLGLVVCAAECMDDNHGHSLD